MAGPASHQPTDPVFRCGITNFRANQIKSNEELLSPIYRRIISLFDGDWLIIDSNRVFLRTYAPRLDFSYIWCEEDGESIDGHWCKPRTICLSQRATEILLHHQVISRTHLRPIVMVDAPLPGTSVLDGQGSMPPPMYSYDRQDFETIREISNPEWAAFSKKPKPLKQITIKQALKYLAEAKRIRPKNFRKGISQHTLESLSGQLELPADWIEVLKKTNGAYLNDECSLVEGERLYSFHLQKQSAMLEAEEEVMNHFIHVAEAPDGDWFSLIVPGSDSSEARVVRTSHETCDVERVWPTIAEFLDEMLRGS